ncbi:MAG: DnaA ATPase domain-containing protein [Tractidigestivibacter sp.]|jgi:chromosomal replication initiator protein|uniref:DnaA ATPase domain-containing protein n=1 Tax=Tractidigestivibacter sp. TaxID=2847320 RepID=UPI003D8FE92A
MEPEFESDADAVWQDTLDLVSEKNLPGSILAMLGSCHPVSLENGVLRVETHSRIVTSRLSKNSSVIDECLTQAAFEPTKIDVHFVPDPARKPIATASTVTAEEAREWIEPAQRATATPSPRAISSEDDWQRAAAEREEDAQSRRKANPLVDDISENDSRLTFDRFVVGEENTFAYQAALQVANGENHNYNPLFIYGKSGLGKTHLLRAIQNYIATNDPSRVCVYKDGSAFITDYTTAMSHREKSAPEILRENYYDIDVLIIDDIQKLSGKTGTVDFFFDAFNHLTSAGKQIVLAADRSPSQLGMGPDGMDERVTSRLDSGFSTSIQTPSYELKLRLINTFLERMKNDGEKEHVPNCSGTISKDNQEYMASKAGANIRVIEGFCLRCLTTESLREESGKELTHEDINHFVKISWPNGERDYQIEDIQRAVEQYFDISHSDLIGQKRNKEIMEARHIAAWLSKELCDVTYAEIGAHFGGRNHATLLHSVRVVEEKSKKDKLYYDRLMQIKESITGSA